MGHSTKGSMAWCLAIATGALLLVVAGVPGEASAYDVHQDRLNCPRGTTLARIEINPRVCRPKPKAGIPATRGRRACCTIDRDPTKERCLPFPQCNAASVE